MALLFISILFNEFCSIGHVTHTKQLFSQITGKHQFAINYLKYSFFQKKVISFVSKEAGAVFDNCDKCVFVALKIITKITIAMIIIIRKEVVILQEFCKRAPD